MSGEGKVFTEAQESLLLDIMNRIIPAEDGFPGAGDLGLASHIDSAVGGSALLMRLFLDGLSHVEIEAHQAAAKEFSDPSPGEKDQVLKSVERERPGFFRALVQHTYNDYYTNPAVFPLIGYEGRPPQPGGYPMKPFDPSLLDNVKKRLPLYRQI